MDLLPFGLQLCLSPCSLGLVVSPLWLALCFCTILSLPVYCIHTCVINSSSNQSNVRMPAVAIWVPYRLKKAKKLNEDIFYKLCFTLIF